jgi:hypothetical protein
MESMVMQSVLEAVTCGWCQAEFEIDPTLAADLFECPGCNERQSLGALRHVDLTADALNISHNFSTATAGHLHRVGLAFTYRKSFEEKVSSGTLVQIGNRLLIATSCHTIPNNPNTITLVPKIAPESFQRRPKVLGCWKSDVVDVGVIEVEADAVRLLGMEALPVDRISDLGPGRGTIKAWLIGYPGAQVHAHIESQTVRFQGLSMSFEPLSIDSWKGVPIDEDRPPYDPDAHVLTHYCIDDPLYVHPDNPHQDKFAPEPFGLSGGGFWQCPESREGKIWSPSMLNLFAIQSSWCKGHRHILGIQIIHWLRLVADVFPDIGEELRDRFPRIGDVQR